MNKRLLVIGGVVLLAGSFLTGAWVSHRFAKTERADSKKILYYVDPMHPAYQSDKPGTAPDCGMPLEPVYADGSTTGGGNSTHSLPPGAVLVSPDRLQQIGVTVAPAEISAINQTLRFSGRVIPDETRIFVINATIEGWITNVTPVTTGSIVKADQILASFYSPEFLSASSALMYALSNMDRVQAAGGIDPKSQVQKDQMAQFNVNLQQYKDSLRNLGMGHRQIEELIKTRRYTENIDITSPAYGVILTRNVTNGQRFVKGEQFFKIADLRKVWVLMDVYQNEADQFKPGMVVKVALPQRQRTFIGKVSKAPPVFDPASRTLKVRLEVDNAGQILRPEMFVDAELQINAPALLSVPAEAVLDSGLKKTVFVEHAPGTFEPREVETGRTIGNRMEILSGLKAGERIAVSGTFLLDSESRMKTAAAGITGTPRQDPVCGMYVDESKSRSKGLAIESGDKAHFFCSDECRQKFLKQPAAKPAAPAQPSAKPKTPGITRERMDHNDHSMHDTPVKEPAAAKPVDHSGHDMHGGMK